MHRISICLIPLLLLVPQLHAQPANVKATDIRGIYSFAWAIHIQKQGMPPAMALDYVDGMTLCMQWRELNPQPGVYRWELIDDVLADVAKHGKLLNLGIFAGIQSPQWVMDQLQEPFTFQRKRHGGEIANNAASEGVLPLPWDQTYTRLWLELNRQLAARYHDHPSIGYLQLHGIGGSAMEMSIRLKPSEYDRFRQAGYSVARYTRCWENLVDQFAELWPRKPLMLTLGTVPADEGTALVPDTARDVQAYAYRKLGDRLLVKVAFLNGLWWQNQGPKAHAKPLIDLLTALGQSGRSTGGEMFWEIRAKGQAAVAGTMQQALKNALDAHMQMVEIYQSDIADYKDKRVYQPFVATLRSAHEQLK
ncbi:MAG TPA: hypothetical protein DCM28_03005 [Phycisphaerales bacterium]|nr:hypothetical protein [Phycisphaerales bacterium]HCD33538.1 hypothetical protein [Phycisphaerales bacterium]|tara:strand:- start:193 stop:1281 length:1089 start_codon:yes stop_codon:yes gene_type:complete